MFDEQDQAHMLRALELAQQGLFTTTPNPRVGCVIAAPDGRVVGEGWHVRAGEPHAEVIALRAAGPLAQGASGVRWCVVEALQAALDRGLLPVIPGQGSVGASGDLAPLAHMTAALMGVGAFIGEGDAAEALARHRLAPLELGPKEGLAGGVGQAPTCRPKGGPRRGIAGGVPNQVDQLGLRDGDRR